MPKLRAVAMRRPAWRSRARRRTHASSRPIVSRNVSAPGSGSAGKCGGGWARGADLALSVIPRRLARLGALLAHQPRYGAATGAQQATGLPLGVSARGVAGALEERKKAVFSSSPSSPTGWTVTPLAGPRS